MAASPLCARPRLDLVSAPPAAGAAAWPYRVLHDYNAARLVWRSIILGKGLFGSTLPPVLGSLSKLKRLWLGFNHLNGSIPAELGSLDELWQLCVPALAVGRRYLRIRMPAADRGPRLVPPATHVVLTSGHRDRELLENQLSGTIPDTLASLKNITDLGLSNNEQLTGTLPAWLGSLPNLQTLCVRIYISIIHLA